MSDAREALFLFTGGGDEEDQPTFAAAVDAYRAEVIRENWRLNVYNDNHNRKILVTWHDTVSSGSLNLTPEEAELIGQCGGMMLAPERYKPDTESET